MYKAFNKIVVDAIKEYAVYDCNDSSRIVAWEPLKPGTLDEDSAIKRLGTHFDKVARRISGEGVSATNRHFNKLEAAVIMELLESILLEDGIFHDILMTKGRPLAPAVLDEAVSCIIKLYYKHIASVRACVPTTLFDVNPDKYFTDDVILQTVREYGANLEDIFRIRPLLLKRNCHRLIDEFFDDIGSYIYEGQVDALRTLYNMLPEPISQAVENGATTHSSFCEMLPFYYINGDGYIEHCESVKEIPDFIIKAINERKPPR